MKSISEIDKNFEVKTKIEIKDIQWFNAENYVYGLIHDSKYRRLPQEIAETVNEGVVELAANTAGGRVRFNTDSEFIAISCTLPSIVPFTKMPATGSHGFDLYVDNVFKASFVPPFECKDGYESVIHLGENKKHEIMIGFPLYNDVTDLYVGIQQNSLFEKAANYKTELPVIFYGSSITQGGCVSRPGISYPAVLSRMLSFDYVNLGFSGSGKGEETMANYIANQKMSAFIYDYDHNAPTLQHLERTHEPFFKIVRKANPQLPIIMLSKPDFRFSDEFVSERRAVIKATYDKAISHGDKNVYFIDGETLWGNEGWDSCTVDGCHPSDMGHYRMAEVICPVLKKVL